jgi:hypothetical protein
MYICRYCRPISRKRAHIAIWPELPWVRYSPIGWKSDSSCTWWSPKSQSIGWTEKCCDEKGSGILVKKCTYIFLHKTPWHQYGWQYIKAKVCSVSMYSACCKHPSFDSYSYLVYNLPCRFFLHEKLHYKKRTSHLDFTLSLRGSTGRE